MRIAVISDIHGNYYALKNVLEDAGRNKVDMYIFAGDYIFDLPFSNEAVYELMGLENACFVAGNKERYLESMKTQDQSEWTHVQMGAAYQTYRELHSDVFDFLTAMKDECIITLDSGKRIYTAHYLKGLSQQSKENCSSSGFRKRMLLTPFTHEEFLSDFNELICQGEYRKAIDVIDASVIIFGHNHLQAYGYCDNKLVINPGSCGQPLDFDSRAPYTVLEETDEGFNVLEMRVEYDIDAAVDLAKRSEMYEKGRIWCELVYLAMRTGRDYFGVMYELARKIAASKGETGSYFSDDTWINAYDEFLNAMPMLEL